MKHRHPLESLCRSSGGGGSLQERHPRRNRTRKDMKKLLLKALLISFLPLTLIQGASAATTSQQTTTSSYAANSAAVSQIQAWLLDHATYQKGSMIGDPGKLGTVQVTYIAHLVGSPRNLQTQGVGDNPPVPLPAGGNPGDTISVTSSSGGYTQSWSFEWHSNSSGGGWALTSYTYKKNDLPPTHQK